MNERWGIGEAVSRKALQGPAWFQLQWTLRYAAQIPIQ